MTREEAISLLTQVNKILVNSNSWLENTHEPLNIAFDMAIKALSTEPCEDCISRNKVLEGKVIHQSCDGVEIINGYAVPIEYIEHLPSIQPKTDALDKIIAEIKEWYWQADKRALAEEPCVVDAMIDLFIRTINKYKTESEE